MHQPAIMRGIRARRDSLQAMRTCDLGHDTGKAYQAWRHALKVPLGNTCVGSGFVSFHTPLHMLARLTPFDVRIICRNLPEYVPAPADCLVCRCSAMA